MTKLIVDGKGNDLVSQRMLLGGSRARSAMP
jgi:hypothetical protein